MPLIGHFSSPGSVGTVPPHPDSRFPHSPHCYTNATPLGLTTVPMLHVLHERHTTCATCSLSNHSHTIRRISATIALRSSYPTNPKKGYRLSPFTLAHLHLRCGAASKLKFESEIGTCSEDAVEEACYGYCRRCDRAHRLMRTPRAEILAQELMSQVKTLMEKHV
jgi:hypothetical protein